MISPLIVVVVLSLVALAQSSGIYGWDTSMVKDPSIIDCLQKKNTAQFIIFPAMDAYAKVDPYVCDELDMAKQSGIPNRDVTFIPCPTCGQSAATQFSMMMDNLNNNCTAASWSGRVWLDMNSNQLWPTPWRDAGYVSNQKWYQQMVDACVNTKGVTCGLYSSYDSYRWILGSDSFTYAPATSFPLWYTTINRNSGKTNTPDNFDDFQAFGGYTQPYAKQYLYAPTTCGGSYTYEDWAPVW